MQKVNPIKQKLYEFFIRTQPIVRTLWGYKEAESEATQLADQVINALIKGIKEEALTKLIRAIEYSNHQLSECVIIPYLFNCDARFTTLYPNANLHVLICKLWRWPDITSSMEVCSNPLMCRYTVPNSLVVCINPQHYTRVGKMKMPQETLLLDHPLLQNAMLARIQTPFQLDQNSITSNLFSASMWNYLAKVNQIQDKMMTDTGPGSQSFMDIEWMSKSEKQESVLREWPMTETTTYKRAAKRRKIECEDNTITETSNEFSPEEVQVVHNSSEQMLEEMDTHEDLDTLIVTPVTGENLSPQHLLNSYEMIAQPFSDIEDKPESRKRRRSENSNHRAEVLESDNE